MNVFKSKNTILALVIEDNSNNGEWEKAELLEEELQLCIDAWKKIYPDMRIVGVCPSNKLPKNIPDEIEFYHHDFGYDFKCGYFNIPLGLKWIEDNIEYEHILHIDLDMYLLKEINMSIENDEVIIGRLNDKEHKSIVRYEYTFESNFILTSKGTNFFNTWWDETMRLEKSYKNDKVFYIEAEELAIDNMYMKNTNNIIPLIDYQFGKRYPIQNVKNISTIYFKHQHINE